MWSYDPGSPELPSASGLRSNGVTIRRTSLVGFPLVRRGLIVLFDDRRWFVDGAIVIRGWNYRDAHLDDIEFNVLDEAGVRLEGSYRLVSLFEEVSAVPWEGCSWAGFGTRYMIVWTPEEPFDAGQQYTLEVTTTSPEARFSRLENTASFVAVQPLAGSLDIPTLQDAQLRVVSRNYTYTCCEDEDYVVSCPEESGRRCWYVSEREKPRLFAEFGRQEGIPEEQLLYRFHDDDGEIAATERTPDCLADITYPADHDGPYCVSVSVEYLATGEMVRSGLSPLMAPSSTGDAASLSHL